MKSRNVKIPVWFWTVSTFLLIWNILGLGSFIQHVNITDDTLIGMTELERGIYKSFPTWATLAFGFAVFGGVFGCIGLLLKQKWSKPVLWVSLIAVLIQMSYSLFVAKTPNLYGPLAVVMPVLIILVAIFMVWMANYSLKKNWLN
ncbi:hypothetical protein QWY93_07040 [Echinicola jeungdonensis]|uniref:Sugar transporter n=1 Tax=Echinicola jeungdonensis TaxID=709343 RepID=A0ABV5JA13_9BACT|nr:hypothetical protein [Echinicola jeungdonensis]MDN3669078.1 hypothetical protein [Echinicola jeungdonensis]